MSVRKAILIILLLSAVTGARAYNDHRGHNLDSLERVVARWTPDDVDQASDQLAQEMNQAYRDLMLGYNVINGEKTVFYARKALSVSRPRGWKAADADAYRYIGQNFYGREQYDSALVYYKASLAAVDAMAAGATSPTIPDGYPEREVDNYYSALYGAIGNLYNMMGDIPEAMGYYEKAGEIFEKYSWNESNSILHYNMGETWVDEGDFRKAKAEYDKAQEFAVASGDSLMMVMVWKGFGRLYMEQGKNRKALPYLRKADAYYEAHAQEEPGARAENLDYMKEVLSRQKRQLGRVTGALVALLLVGIGFFFGRKKKRAAEEKVENQVDAPKLSAREKEILDLLSKGYTTPQIGEALHLSHETIRWYRKRLLEKFDVSNTPELISQAKETGAI